LNTLWYLTQLHTFEIYNNLHVFMAEFYVGCEIIDCKYFAFKNTVSS